VHGVMRSLGKLFRLWPAWIVSILLVYVIYAVAPQQIPVTMYKALVLTLGGIIGFWLHVWVEGHVDELQEAHDRQRALDRRALYCVGGMIAFALAA